MYAKLQTETASDW